MAEELKEWIQLYLKNRDVLQRSITGFESLNGDLIVHKDSGDVIFFIRPELDEIESLVDKARGKSGLVVLNTQKNLNAVLKNWDALSTLKELCIYFVNPIVNEKWLLYPYEQSDHH